MFRVHLAVLVDAGHVLVVALLGLDLVREPFLQEGREFLVQVICVEMISRVVFLVGDDGGD